MLITKAILSELLKLQRKLTVKAEIADEIAYSIGNLRSAGFEVEMDSSSSIVSWDKDEIQKSLDASLEKNLLLKAEILSLKLKLDELRPFETPSAFSLNYEEMASVKGRKTIQAIKMVRDRTGLGLKECKDLVVAYKDTLSPEDFTALD